MSRDFGDAPRGESSTTGNVFVPSQPGYRIIRYRHLEDHLDACAYGLKVARVKIETRIVTIFIGMGISPTNHRPFIRTIAAHHEMDGCDQPFGMALEGNPLAPETSPGRGMNFNYLSEAHVLMLSEQKRAIETILEGLKRFGAITGASVDRKMICLAFEHGLLEDLLVTSLKNEDIPGGIARWDQDSVETCTDLLYEIGCGIVPEPEPMSVVQVRPDEPVLVAEVKSDPGMISEYENMLRFVLSHIGKGKPLEGFILEALAHNNCELVTTGYPVQSLLVTGAKNLLVVNDVNDVTHDPGPIVFRPAHHLTELVVKRNGETISIVRMGCLHVGNHYVGQWNWLNVHGDMMVYHRNRSSGFGFVVF
jgi:hypothetical protein